VKVKTPSALSREDKALLALGRAAERFVEADREAREARRQRNRLSHPCERNHIDGIPCFRLGYDRVWSEEGYDFVDTDPLPEKKWCKSCRQTAPLHGTAWWGYYRRRSARAAMTAAYRRLIRLRHEVSHT
jgi:hypothetical protein